MIKRKIYSNHSHFHKGDSGLDLYILEDLNFDAFETKNKIRISCETEDGKKLLSFFPDQVFQKHHLEWQTQ